MALGVIGMGSNKNTLPNNAFNLERPCWIVTQEHFNIHGTKSRTSKFFDALDSIKNGSIVTVSMSATNTFSFSIDSRVFNDVIVNLPNQVYPIFDLYGKCQKATLICSDNIRVSASASEDNLNPETENIQQNCEKADLEVHVKESEQITPTPSTSNVASGSLMSRSVMESVTANEFTNISIKNRSAELRNSELSNSW